MSGPGQADDVLTRETLLERTSDAVVVLDADLTCIRINERAEQLLDRGRDELVGSHIWTVFPDMAGTDARTQIEEARDTDRQGTYEWHDTEGDRWFEVRVFPDDGAVSLFFRDVTTRKEREREIERYERLLGHLPMAVERGGVGEDGAFTFVTDPLVELLGADSAEELTEHASADVFASDADRDAVRNALRTDGYVEDMAVQLRTLDGETFWGEVTASEERIGGEQFVVALFEDVSERRVRDRRIQWADNWFRNAHDGLFVVDVEDSFAFERVNPSFAALTGLSDDAVEGRTPQRVFGDDDGDALCSHYRECLSRGEPVDCEVDLAVPASGVRVRLAIRLAPVRVDGEIEQLVGAARDLGDAGDETGSPAWFEPFVDHAREFAVVVDAEELITAVSPSVDQVTGHDAGALVGTDFLDRVHPDDRDAVRSVFERLRDGSTATERYRFEGADGSWATVESTVENCCSDPEIDGYVLVTRDVSEQSETEETLQQVQQRLELAIEGSDISTWEWNAEAGDFAFTDEWANAVETAEGDPEFGFDVWADLIHPADVDDARAAFEAHLAGETDRYDHEHRMQTDDGDWRWVRTIGRVLERDDRGDPLRATGLHINITERNHAQQKLTKTAKALEAIVTTSPDAIVAVDTTGEVILWNEAAEEMFGWSTDEVLGGRLPFAARGEFEAVLGQGDGSGVDRTVETVRETKSGEAIDVKLCSTRIEDEDGLAGYLGTYKDVTDQRRAERQLDAHSETLDLLTRIVGHDIRNDLQMILGYTEQLAKYVDDEGKGNVREIFAHAKTAGELAQTTQTLANSMRQVGDRDRAVSLRNTLGQELDELRSRYTNALITTDGQIPAVDVAADETISAVFRNVLTNAVEHNDKEVPEVAVTVAETDDEVVVSVADNGPGVPDNQKERIFDRGSKGSHSDGTGIGLYLAKVLTEQYGGDVWVEDAVASETTHGENKTVSPEGAVFQIRLPLA